MSVVPVSSRRSRQYQTGHELDIPAPPEQGGANPRRRGDEFANMEAIPGGVSPSRQGHSTALVYAPQDKRERYRTAALVRAPARPPRCACARRLPRRGTAPRRSARDPPVARRAQTCNSARPLVSYRSVRRI